MDLDATKIIIGVIIYIGLVILFEWKDRRKNKENTK